MKSTSILVAKAALLNDKNEILILTRSSTAPTRPGEYDFPGGGIEFDEGPDEAIVREIREEIGIELGIDDLELGYTATTYYNDQSAIRFLYVGKVKENPPIQLSFEHSDFQWMTLEEVYSKYSHPVWVEGLRYVLEHGLFK